jgi:hypothetical protein
MKAERFFYAGTGALFLVLTFAGFQKYIFGGKHEDGNAIAEQMVATVAVHSASIFAWYVLYFVQCLLIAVQNRGLHRKLGWSALAVGSMIAVTGPMVAIRSVRSAPANAAVFDWPLPQFLLIMLTEILLFLAFAAIGVLYRQRPAVHRPMMMLAGLALISGATGRIAWVVSIFGTHTWTALFGPVIALGALLGIVRYLLARRVESAFAYGFAGLALVSVIAAMLAGTNTWVEVAKAILRL